MPDYSDDVEISILSTEYLIVTLTSDVDPLDLGLVQMAFTEGYNTEPVEADWQTAAVNAQTVQLLIGPDGGYEIPIGYYLVWTRLADVIEQPVEAVGYLRVF